MELIIIAAIDPNIAKPGGIQNYVMNLINFISNSINVTLIGISKIEKSSEYANFIPVVKKTNVSSYIFLLNLLLKTPFLKISKSSIIHIQRPETMLPFVLFFRENPKVCTLHGLANKGIFHKKGKLVGTIYLVIERYTLKHTDAVIAVSDEIKDEYLQKYPWLKDKFKVIPVGFDEKLFRPLDKNKMRQKYGFSINDKIILYVGRFEKEKRLDTLLTAFKEIKNEIINAKLVLVGDGREKHNLENLIKKLDIKDVVILNTIEHVRIPEIMNCADVFALTSMYEGMPTVVLEALACGIPVVSTDVGDVYKVVNNKTGYIIRSNENYDEYAKLLIKCLEQGENMKEDCVKIVQSYYLEKIAEKTMAVYKEC
ncbi:MAG: glycosyltransferase family 4 protein, partial [ANME-2 cluster archaeon]|nr:glycosyltransferase family 4 protein [ANME-2 cluster archaeon]